MVMHEQQTQRKPVFDSVRALFTALSIRIVAVCDGFILVEF